jgi:hypothetical protein
VEQPRKEDCGNAIFNLLYSEKEKSEIKTTQYQLNKVILSKDAHDLQKNIFRSIP